MSLQAFKDAILELSELRKDKTRDLANIEPQQFLTDLKKIAHLAPNINKAKTDGNIQPVMDALRTTLTGTTLDWIADIQDHDTKILDTLSQLLVLSNLLGIFPPEMLGQIDTMTKNLMKTFGNATESSNSEAPGAEAPNPEAMNKMMEGMMGMMGNLLGGGGGSSGGGSSAGIGGLLAGMGDMLGGGTGIANMLGADLQGTPSRRMMRRRTQRKRKYNRSTPDE